MLQPLKILVAADVPPDPNAGASGTVYQMNQALKRIGHDVHEVWQHHLQQRIRHGNLHYIVELPREYRRVISDLTTGADFDVIEVNQAHSYLAAADHQRRRREGVFVTRTHGHDVRGDRIVAYWQNALDVPKRSLLRRSISRVVQHRLDQHWDLACKHADGIHVSCQEDSSYLVENYGFPADRIGVITQGVPEAFITRPACTFEAARMNRILFVGQYAFVKAPMMLAEAVNRILAVCSAATMTWVCGQPQHEQVRRLLAPEIQSRVTLRDWMSQDELIDVYDTHGVFLFPSFFEGFGKTPLEAMARGLCVIASRVGGMRDYIADGRTGVLVDVGAPQEMAHRALALMRSVTACQDMSTAARAAACAHTWDRCAMDLTRYYEKLINWKCGGKKLL